MAACSAGVSRFDFPAFNLGSDGSQAPSAGASYNGSGGGSPQIYSYRPNDNRYGGTSGRISGRMANESYVQKYSGTPGSQPVIRNNEFEVSSIARERVERQQVAPPRDHNVQRQRQYENRNSAANRPYQPAPTARRQAPVAPTPVAPTGLASHGQTGSKGGTITVRQGDTLFNLSQRHNVSVAALRSANGLETNDIRIGQQLVIPGASASAQTTRTASNGGTNVSPPAPVEVKSQIKSQIKSPAPVAKVPAPEVATPRAPATKKHVRMAKVNPNRTATPQNNFRWPVRGRILTKFGAKADGSHNDGVNIAVPRGTEVKAAEGGVVAYAGSELKAYGKLILVRHPNNWVTAYAHNDEILVKRGDKIRRGQVISKAGTTGSVTQPQLHFELRKGSSPVDPTKYISGS